MERECLDCGNTLRGRTDKKFCDDQCRSNFNNRMKIGQHLSLRPVNSILRKNHTILSRLCGGKKVRVKKDDLLRYGFDLNYHTHLYHTQNGNTYFFCYEYGYLPLTGGMFLLVKQEKIYEQGSGQ